MLEVQSWTKKQQMFPFNYTQSMFSLSLNSLQYYLRLHCILLYNFCFEYTDMYVLSVLIKV